jgi:hypothetical protein
MNNKLIIVPKDKNAQTALDFDKADKEQLIELTIDEIDFLFLFENGIIDLINFNGNSNIDDYEDDVVSGKENLYNVIIAIESTSTYENIIVKKILYLFKEAYNRDTSVYFYF